MKKRQNDGNSAPKSGRVLLGFGIFTLVGFISTLIPGYLFLSIPLLFFGWKRNRAYKAYRASQEPPKLSNPQVTNTEPAVVFPSSDIPELSNESTLLSSAPATSDAKLSSVDYTIIKPKSKKALADIPKNDYTVFDVETTGLSPDHDQIIEIAMVRHSVSGNEERYHTLVNPRCEISPRITRLTGITNDNVADAPYIEDCIKEILAFIDDSPLVAHNANFDMKFLCAALRAHGIPASFSVYDTLEMSRRAFPDLPDHKLQTLITELKLSEHDQTHRAADDTDCTKRLFEICCSKLLTEKEEELAARRAAKSRT